MIKDAEYYLQRIKDLPYDLLSEIREMYKEAESHRFICISIKELCQKLRLEYEEGSFAKKCQENYLRINSYLEALGLKLIPCSVPADLSFTDKIYVTPKPNLNNDPDCSYVRGLIEAKKTPTAKDLTHITRMNLKLSNYNVMLRVFEGLFVVCSGKLDPHQRVTLNSVISEMELPKEGQAYLRACYTYACEFRNHHCDYSSQSYCFKPLNEEMQLRVSRYLALIAASSSYREPFNQEYPFLEALELEYKKLGVAVRKPAAQFSESAESTRNSKYSPISSLERLFIELKVVAFNYLSSLNCSKEQNLEKRILKNSKALDSSFVSAYLRTIACNAPSGLSMMIPDDGDLELSDFSALENARAVPKLYLTENKQMSLLYPNICYKNTSDLLSSSFFEEYKAYLLNATVIKDSQTQNLKTVTSTRTNNSILFFNYFIRLVLKDCFISRDEKQRTQALSEAFEDYRLTLRPELLFLSCLSFVLYDLNSQLKKGRVKMTDSLLTALFTYPELSRLCVYSMLVSEHRKTLEEYYQSFPEAFELYIFTSLFKNSDKKYKWLDDLKCQTAYLPKYIISIVRSEISKAGIHSFIKTGTSALAESLKNNQHRKLDRNIVFDDALKALNSGPYRDLQVLFTHPVFADIFAPMLCEESLNHIAGALADVQRENEDSLYESLSARTEIIRYLSGVSIDTNKSLADLLTDNLSRLDAQLIRRSLKDQTFTKYNQLCDFLKIEYSFLATECIERALPKLGLMIVPIDQSLPKEARSKLTYHRIIATGLDEEAISREFIHKLCAAQMAYIIFSFIVPVSSADVRLSRYMELTPEQNVFTLKFLSTIKNLMKGAKPFDRNYYRKLSAEQRNNSNYKLCLRYLKQLAIDEVAQSPLKNYLEEKFNELFASLNVREHSMSHSEASEQKTLSARSKESADRKLQGSFAAGAANSIKSSEHSFFKAASFDVRKLDSSLIASKLSESAQIQDVINRIRIDEGTLEGSAEYEAQSAVSTEKTPNQDQEQQKAASCALPSDACRQLVLSLKAQSSDVIDMSEFKGLCLSLKFMSMDAAVEELNDWSYETFDEMLLDLSPEENCIYITTDLLDKI